MRLLRPKGARRPFGGTGADMPVRRRTPKKVSRTVDMLDAWGPIFDFGCDFFHDRDRLGYRSEAAVLKAARAAWAQYGAAYLASDLCDQEAPWALKQFGKP